MATLLLEPPAWQPTVWIAPPVVALVTLGLAGWARSVGWVDAPPSGTGGAGARKLQPVAVPVVGGAALLCGVAVLATRPDLLPSWGGSASAGFFASLIAVFLVGLVDDLRREGLGVTTKLGLQLLAVLPWALEVAATPAGRDSLLFGGAVIAALLALNVANTFDNADGALGGLGLVGLLAAGSPLGLAVAGFLPFNLSRRRPIPTSYLGDSGSHVLGFLLIATPGAWPVLLLPALDLARLTVVRPLSGQAPWRGDRRHLAHRLLRRGWTPPRVALVLAAVSAPALLAAPLGSLRAGEFGWAGPLATLLFFQILLVLSDPGSNGNEPERA